MRGSYDEIRSRGGEVVAVGTGSVRHAAAFVADEDEYFPPPPELRELFAALDVVGAATLGGPLPAGSRGIADDRSVAASDVLAAMPSP